MRRVRTRSFEEIEGGVAGVLIAVGLIAAAGCSGTSPTDSESTGLSPEELVEGANEACHQYSRDLARASSEAVEERRRALRHKRIRDQTTRLRIASADSEIARLLALLSGDLGQLDPGTTQADFGAFVRSLSGAGEAMATAAEAVEVIDAASRQEAALNYALAARQLATADRLAAELGLDHCANLPTPLDGPAAPNEASPVGQRT